MSNVDVEGGMIPLCFIRPSKECASTGDGACGRSKLHVVVSLSVEAVLIISKIKGLILIHL